MEQHDEPAVIGHFSDELSARTAAAHLAAEGIEARVLTDNAGGSFPSMSSLGSGVRLVVRSDDEATARTILEAEDSN